MTQEKSKPFFSVVIPVYNKEKVVERAINSVLDQSFSNFEIIVICDPSTDESSAKVAEFNDDRLRIFHRDKPGPGGYAARNLGIINSDADWICFLDADDEWLPNHLMSSKNIVQENPHIEFISHNYASVSNLRSQQLTEKAEFMATGSGNFTRDQVVTFLSRNNIFQTNGVVLKKELLLKAGMFPDGKAKRGGDIDLFLRALFNTDCVYISDIVTSRYYLDESGVAKYVSTTGNVHPITVTIKSLLAGINKKSTRKNLMLLSNRKAFLWSMQRKLEGVFEFSELRNFFFSRLRLAQWKRMSFLLLPNGVARGVVMIYKKLSNRV